MTTPGTSPQSGTTRLMVDAARAAVETDRLQIADP